MLKSRAILGARLIQRSVPVPVFILAQINIHDPATYASYEAGFGEVFARYDGALLSVDDNPETLEGDWPTCRTVIIQFPSADEAKRWFRSEEYQAIATHRKAASVGHIALVKGFEP